ncbi:hypothetical protein XA68_12403 [Ophiocordyceps unilateralis]|uniref:Deoxyribonuclease NucA/NucB domain-containing protein n=1 Tax=Ophiocordyceps unilateralis TaxID=268505 RepID=A0A2A9PF16_OPHUN|nr:hypothetical protein XA68_12403 [Ophiocordyceps unilateralis]
MMLRKALPLALALPITASIAAEAAPPDITFLCQEMPDICTNMCWAVRCAKPTFSQQLTLDYPSDDLRRQRLESSGCARCASNATVSARNDACNAYPFPDTSESVSSNASAVSRCVPREQQTKQDADVAILAKKFRQTGQRSFRINFGNPGAAGVKYCLSEPCENDDREEQEEALQKRALAAPFRVFMTNSGMTVASMDDLGADYSFTRRVGAEEKLSPQAQMWQEDFKGERYAFVTDSVVREMNAAEIRGKTGR